MEKRKKGERGSALDVFLILLLLFSLLTVGLRVYRLRGAEDITQRAQVVLFAENVRGETAREIRVGDRLYAADGSFYGAVSEVRTRGSTVELLEGGRRYVGEWDPALWCDLFLTVEIGGRERGGVFYQNGSQAVLFARQIPLHTQWISLFPKAVSVAVLE